MRKILLSFATAFACCIIAVCAGCGDKKKPEPIKDGEALTMTEIGRASCRERVYAPV